MVLQTSFRSLSPVLLQPPQWGAVPAVRVVSPGPRGTTGVEDRAGAGSRLREPTPLSPGFLGGSWKRVSAAAPGPRAVPREGRQISGSQCCVCCRLLRPCRPRRLGRGLSAASVVPALPALPPCASHHAHVSCILPTPDLGISDLAEEALLGDRRPARCKLKIQRGGVLYHDADCVRFF